MLGHLLLYLVATALCQSVVAAALSYVYSNLDRFLITQRKTSIQGVLANIGSNGKRAKGAAPGVVVASPSQSDPDCKCFWEP